MAKSYILYYWQKREIINKITIEIGIGIEIIIIGIIGIEIIVMINLYNIIQLNN